MHSRVLLQLLLLYPLIFFYKPSLHLCVKRSHAFDTITTTV